MKVHWKIDERKKKIRTTSPQFDLYSIYEWAYFEQKLSTSLAKPSYSCELTIEDLRCSKNSQISSLDSDITMRLDESTGKTKVMKNVEFRCKICEKKFSKKVNLKTHIFSIHEQNRSFECLLCGKKFKVELKV